MRLRGAVRSDAGDIRTVHLLAFPTPAEGDLVEQLERDGDALVSIVAVENGRIAGHILLSRMDVRADGCAVSAAALAPLAVMPEMQRRGIGSALSRAAIQEARRCDIDMIFVLGDTEFYGAFGFDAGAAQHFSSPYACAHFQVLRLNPALGPVRVGTASHAPAFSDL